MTWGGGIGSGFSDTRRRNKIQGSVTQGGGIGSGFSDMGRRNRFRVQ